MISCILGSNIQFEFDPNSPLNKAHQEERAAERCLTNGDFEGAVKHFKAAECLMKESLKLSTNENVINSLNLQLARLRVQPLILRKKKEETEIRKRYAEEARKLAEAKLLEDNMKVQSITSSEESMESASVQTSSKELEAKSDEDETDKGQSSIKRSKEAEELLDCLRVNSSEDGENIRYTLANVMHFFGGWSKDAGSVETNRELAKTSDDQKSQYIPKLEQQNVELCDHIKQLFQNLKSCEDENSRLKEKMENLERDLENRSVTNSRSLRDDVQMDIAFSNDHFDNDHFDLDVGTPVSSLPSMEPLELPEFIVDNPYSGTTTQEDLIDIT